MRFRTTSRRATAVLLLLVCAALLALPAPASADRLYNASLRNGDYGGGFIVDTFNFYTCSDPDGSSCGDGDLSNIGIVNSPDGVLYTNQHAVINFPVGRDFPGRLTGFRAHGTVSFWFRADRATHVSGQPITDNYGFNQFNNGQGSFGVGLSRNDGGTPANQADDMVQIGWSTWHSNVWYAHTTAQGPVLMSYDEWHHVGLVWGGATNDFEVWVDGQLRAWNTLPAGVTKSWGSTTGLGSGYNFALGEIHERTALSNSTVYGVTFSELSIWDEARPRGDYPAPPAPTLTSIVPSSGPTAGGTAIRIAGTMLFDATVTIGGANASIVSSQPEELIVTTPPGVAGARDVVVTTFEGAVTSPGGFTYEASARIADLAGGGVATRQPALDGRGRHLAFVSADGSLVAGDTNAADDVFVYDRGTGVTARVSVSSEGAQANGPSERPSLSADGRFVAFVSTATNLVADDTNGAADVFVHDRDADGNGVFDEAGGRATRRVSVATTGEQANGPSAMPDLGADGRWLAFVSAATNLVAGDTNAVDDVFLHHWPSGLTVRVSVATGGGQSNGASVAPSVSSGGRRVLFASDATNLVADDGNERRDVFLHDRENGQTLRVSTAAGTNGVGNANGHSDRPSIDDAGVIVAFQTLATDIVSGVPASPYSQVLMFTLPEAEPALAADGERVSAAVVDIGAAIRTLVSTAGQSQPGNGDSTGPQVAGDGGGIAFDSAAGNLVPGDTNGEPDVFVARVTGPGQAAAPVRASTDAAGNESSGASEAAALSGDAAVTAFESAAGLTPGTQTPVGTRVFVRAQRLVVSRIVPDFAPAGADTGVVIEGAGFAPGTQVRIGGLAPAGVSVESETRLVVGQLPLVASPAVVDVLVTTPDGETVTLPGAFTFTTAAPATDSDADGLPDAWEIAYGLNPNSGTGNDGAAGDPDGDGVGNAAEHARTTHPRGGFANYLAEGAVGTLFSTTIGLANPSPTATATALLRFQRRTGAEVSHRVTVPPRESRSIAVAGLPDMAEAEFATVVESDVPLLVDRAMRWDRTTGYGLHSERAVKVASPIWYLAEGATHSGFDLFYLLQNPSSTTDAVVTIRYLLPDAPELLKTYTVRAGTRANVWVDFEEFPDGSGNFALANTDVSAVIQATNGVPLIVERAMYQSRTGQLYGAGHGSAAVTEPALTWLLAEGATGDIFDLFLLLANPNPTAATARISYLLDDGRTFTKIVTVEGNSRRTIWVDYDTPDGATGQPLQAVALSTKVEVLNAVPIIVERAMWWPGGPGQWYEAHNSPGSTVTGTEWGIAGAEVSGAPDYASTYVLIANTSAQVADARVTLLLDGAPAVSKDVLGIAASSRRTLDIAFEFPESAGRTFGVLVESLGATPAQLVVESAVYRNAAGVWWGAGANELATRLR